MKNTAAFQLWSTVAAGVRTIALLVLLAFIYLFLENKPLPLGNGTVTPLTVFWKLVVPLVPVILLVAPAVWRNICPLAFFNMAGYWLRAAFEKTEQRRLRGRLKLAEPGIRKWLCSHGTWVAILLLCILVPARLFLFNSNAQSLDILLLLLAVLTFACGVIIPFKSGWSASICPVYPVECLYGMNPFVHLDNTMCVEKAAEGRPQTLCGGCTRRCLDLTIGSAAASKADAQWHPTPTLRFFISAFPGFVLAYWILDSKLPAISPHVPAVAVPMIIYAGFIAAMALSACCAEVIRKVKKPDERNTDKQLDLALVAVAFNLYYWMAIPAAVKTVCMLSNITPVAVLPVAGVLLAGIAILTVLWLGRASAAAGNKSGE